MMTMTDRRLVFKLDSYNNLHFRPEGCPGVAGDCIPTMLECGGDHRQLTHGGHPVAMTMFSEQWSVGNHVGGYIARVATPDAVPFELATHCPIPDTEPHDHEEFWWR